MARKDHARFRLLRRSRNGVGRQGAGHGARSRRRRLGLHALGQTVDGAAIYIFAAKHCTVRGNYTHDVRDEQVHAYYLDEQSEGSIVERNVAVDVPWPIHNHMSWNCAVRDNFCISQGDMTITFANCHNFYLARNVFACGGELKVRPSYTGIGRMSGNIFSSRAGRVSWGFHDRLPSLDRNPGAVSALPLNKGSVIADPGCRCSGGKVTFTDRKLARRLRSGVSVPLLALIGAGRNDLTRQRTL